MKEVRAKVYKIFLSHSSYDRLWVDRIANGAKNNGIEVYLYEHDPQPGTAIADKIERNIRGSDALVVLLTQNSRYSPYVQQEIGFAKASGKQVIPLVQSGVGRESLAMLEGTEYIPFDLYNPEEAVSKLLSYVRKLKQNKEGALGIVILGLVGLLFLAGLSGEEK